jgi:hypothetical protein
MKALLLISCFVAVIGLVGHEDYKTELFSATITTCEQSGGATLTATGRQCNDLIHQVQSQFNIEVLSDANGSFWIEEK